MKLRYLTALAVVLGLAVPLVAQTPAKDGTLAALYDVDSTTLTYCVTRGQDGSPFGPPIPGPARIATVGSSTTVTESVASTNPFTNVAVGDVLIIRAPNSSSAPPYATVAVTAKASAASITVDTAVNLSATGGYVFSYLRHACGTTDADGWFAVGGASRVAMTVQYDQGDLGELVARWECRQAGAAAQPVILYPGVGAECGFGTLSTDRCSWTSAGIASRLTIVETSATFTSCRVGVAYVTSDASDATTNREKVTINVSLR